MCMHMNYVCVWKCTFKNIQLTQILLMRLQLQKTLQCLEGTRLENCYNG